MDVISLVVIFRLLADGETDVMMFSVLVNLSVVAGEVDGDIVVAVVALVVGMVVVAVVVGIIVVVVGAVVVSTMYDMGKRLQKITTKVIAQTL